MGGRAGTINDVSIDTKIEKLLPAGKKVYVVMPHFIVTQELKELAANAIKSFKEYSDCILISVDDGSPMDTSFLKELSDVYIRNEKNSGFAITCNNGYRWVEENEKEDCYIIFANNDIVINKRVIPALKEPFDMFDNVAISGIWSTDQRNWQGKELEDCDFGRMSDGGLLGDRMMDGGLVCSKKSILQKISIYRKK